MNKGVEVVERKREGGRVGSEEPKGEKRGVEGLFIEIGICPSASAFALASAS